jgi:alpha-mannosidase
VTLDNHVDDHRFRLRFPTGAPVAAFRAATTFDVAARSTTTPEDTQWVHPAPTTFPQQGWVAPNGLLIGAPGLPEAEVTADGAIAVTLLRSVGWLSRSDLRTRPVQAGPGMPAPGAQCHGTLSARLVIARALDPSIARDAELGFHAVPVGDTPLLESDVSLLTLAPRELELSTVKPASDDDGVIVRVLNPTDDPLEAHLRVAWQPSSATAVRLDETQTEDDVRMSGGTVAFDVPAHALRAVHLH